MSYDIYSTVKKVFLFHLVTILFKILKYNFNPCLQSHCRYTVLLNVISFSPACVYSDWSSCLSTRCAEHYCAGRFTFVWQTTAAHVVYFFCLFFIYVTKYVSLAVNQKRNLVVNETKYVHESRVLKRQVQNTSATSKSNQCPLRDKLKISEARGGLKLMLVVSTPVNW